MEIRQRTSGQGNLRVLSGLVEKHGMARVADGRAKEAGVDGPQMGGFCAFHAKVNGAQARMPVPLFSYN